MSKLNLFIDAGNVVNTKTSDLLSEIALVKNMEQIESVFVFSNGKNVLKDAVEKGGDAKQAARDEYAEIEIAESDSLNNKPNKIVIYNSNNADLIGKFEEKLKPLKDNSLMICVPNDSAELDVLSLFTQKTPTAFKNIQLFVPKGDATFDNLVMNMVKDAKRLRELKINISASTQAGGAFFGLFGKKKYDVKAAEIAKKLLKEGKNYDDVKNDVKAELQKYYGYEEGKTDLTGSALKKQNEAKNNVARALYTVEKLLADTNKKSSIKAKSYSKLTTGKKADKQNKYDNERAKIMGERGLKISKGKSEEVLQPHLLADKKATKDAFGDADLIICHEDDKATYPPNVPCIRYNKTTIHTLDLVLRAQFSEPTRLRELFYRGTGTKKASIRSQIKRRISRMGDIDIVKTRKRRSSSLKRLEAKIKSKAIPRTPMNNKKASEKHVNTVSEVLATKKAELKRLGFALFGEKRTKKKQLQANIAELEKKKAGK